MTPAAVHDEIKRLRTLVEQHEARAREHSDERAGLCAELARVTSERDESRHVVEQMHVQVETARRVAANIERERHALREAYDRDTAALRAEASRVQGLLDDVAHAHERDLLAIWKALGETHEPPQDVAAILGRIDALRGALDRAHHTLREHGPRCSHPACDELAPYRCDDCGERFCADHDDGLEGHDLDAGPLPHAVGPDDPRVCSAMREAGSR